MKPTTIYLAIGIGMGALAAPADEDAINYLWGQVVEFHRRAAGASACQVAPQNLF